jgi:hypothetical protein
MNQELNTMERLDAWLERGEGGTVPMTVLRKRGVEIVEPRTLDDDALHSRLWELLEAMAGIGIFVWGTDHLSDRELYERIVSEVLTTEIFLEPDDPYAGETFDMIGNGTDESERVYLTYYADDEDRAQWLSDFGKPLPPRQPKPYDRDRLMPSLEGRADARTD